MSDPCFTKEGMLNERLVNLHVPRGGALGLLPLEGDEKGDFRESNVVSCFVLKKRSRFR